MKPKTKYIVFIFIFFLTIPLKTNAEQLYIPYNKNEWFENWRETEFDSNPTDFCIIVDESGSTKKSDPSNIRYIVIKQFITHFKSDDRVALVQDNGTDQESQLLLHELSTNKNDIINSIGTKKGLDGNNPLHSVNVCLNQLASGEELIRNKLILHLGDGAFGYNEDPQIMLNLVKIDEALVSSIKDYGVKMYTIGFTNNESDYPKIEETGSLKKMATITNGKYYRLKIGDGDKTQETEEEKQDVCNDQEYANNNHGKCCEKYPETCCLETSFIENESNWNTYFVGENEWRKDLCCENETFKKKYSTKCNVRVNSCSNPEYAKSEENYCACKPLVCNENFSKDCIGKFIYDIYQIIKIIATILLLILTTIDFVKAMISGSDKTMKKSVNTFIRRLIIVLVLLFTPSIINLFLGLISNGKWSTCGIR